MTVLSAHMDMGQGIYTGLATLVAEELDADWAQMRVDGAAGNPKLYGNLAWGGVVQGTGGSTAMPSSWDRYRQAGAAARAMLVEAAADELGRACRPRSRSRTASSAHAGGKQATLRRAGAEAAASWPRRRTPC